MSQYSAEEAADIHCELTHQTYKTLCQATADQLELQIAGDPRHPFFAQAPFNPSHLSLQTEGDLGDKMRLALNQQIKTHQAVVLVGSDCPVFTPDIIEQAFVELEKRKSDVVLTPAEDGGFVLIGCNCSLPEDLFQGITWGQDDVLERTKTRLEYKGLELSLLPMLWDVDHPEDVLRWQQLTYKKQ